jgi:vacuolar-type H+-ATPase subunit E/Vma4
MDPTMAPDPTTEDLFQVIYRQVENERTALLAEAEALARGLREKAAAEAEHLRSEAFARLEQELRAEELRLMGEARMEARNERLKVKRRYIKEAFRLAGEELLRLSGTDGYSAALRALLSEALEAAGNANEAVVAVREGEEDACRAALKALGFTSLIRGSGNRAATLTVTSADGRRRMDNGLLSRLVKAESIEESEVAKILFGSSGGDS